MKTKQRVTKGVRFRSTYADGNPLWEVKASAGKGAWACEVVSEKFVIDGKEFDSDWAGVRKLFTSKEILASVSMGRLYEQAASDQDAFYASLNVGQIVHYNNGFQQFVRCKVVCGTDKDGKEGNALLPIALVGNWLTHDLPRRQANGSIFYAYYPKMILENGTFTPNYSNIVESSAYRPCYGEPDPNALQPIDLSVPEMIATDAEKARLYRLREEAAELLRNYERTDHRCLLAEVCRLIENGLDNGD